MSRIAERFAALAREGRKALIPYITAGDPQPSVTVPTLHAMVAAGADIVELGVPFSDPMADGPVIAAAHERALAHHVSLGGVLAMVAEFRRSDAHTPVVLMGYLNPIEVMGYSEFARRAREAGVDGVLTVDLPPEEAGDLEPALREQGLDPIFLLAPNSSEARIRRVGAAAAGFIYYVSLKGVTGSASLDVEAVTARLEAIRAAVPLPIGVGFGIKDAASAARIAAAADGVVIGSAIVGRIAELAARPQAVPSEIAGFLKEIRAAMDASGH